MVLIGHIIHDKRNMQSFLFLHSYLALVHQVQRPYLESVGWLGFTSAAHHSGVVDAYDSFVTSALALTCA